MLLDALLANPLKYKFDQEGYDDYCLVQFATITCTTRSYKLIVNERAIWANEMPIIKVNGFDNAKRTVKNFERMLLATLSEHVSYSKNKDIDWKNFSNEND